MARGSGDRLAGFERLLPDSGDVTELVAAVAQRRGRPIQLLPLDHRTDGLTGLWASTDVQDYIYYPANSAPTQRRAVICHELAHMALGHEPDEATAVRKLAATVAPLIDPAIAARMLARHTHHDSGREVEAEQLGTQLAAQLEFRAARAALGGVYLRLR